MTDLRDLPTTEALVANDAWIRRLAERLLADSSRAGDVAQEAWLRAARRPPSSPAALRPWLHTVVRNLVCRSFRDDARRASRERAVARPERVEPSAASLLERAELQRRVRDVVLALREPYRSTVLLRYFEGLRAEEIARRQDVSPATVRSRLGRAHAELRIRLESERRSWALLAAPLVATLPEAATPLSASSTVSLGALTMSQKILCGGAACIFLGAAVGLGVSAARAPGPDHEQALAMQSAVGELSDKLEQTEAELARLRASERRLAAENTALRKRLEAMTDSLHATADEPTGGAAQEAVAGASPAAAFDWSGLVRLMAKNAEILQANSAELTAAEEASLAELYSELRTLSARAKSRHANPLYASGFLTGLARALYGGGLGMDEAQLAELEALARQIEAELPDPDLELAPLEHYSVRKSLAEGLHREVEKLLRPDQRDSWPKLQDLSDRLLAYSNHLTVGVESAADSLARNWTTNALRPGDESFSFEPLVPAAERLRQGASELLQRYGVTDGKGLEALRPELQARLAEEFLALQERYEAEVLPLVSEELRARYRDRPPMILEFRPGGGMGIRTTTPYF